MKTVKLINGNVFVHGDIFFNRNEEVEVNDELAASLLKEVIHNYDPDLRTINDIPYFVEVASAPKAKVVKEKE